MEMIALDFDAVVSLQTAVAGAKNNLLGNVRVVPNIETVK
jgi:hypothetical protein